MLCRYSLNLPGAAAALEGAVDCSAQAGPAHCGHRAAEGEGVELVGTQAMGEALLAALESSAGGEAP